MVTVGSFHAKTHLPELLKRVEKGEKIQITRRGTPVALLVPVPAAQGRDPREAARRIRQLRKGVRLGDLKLRDLIEAGRP